MSLFLVNAPGWGGGCCDSLRKEWFMSTLTRWMHRTVHRTDLDDKEKESQGFVGPEIYNFPSEPSMNTTLWDATKGQKAASWQLLWTTRVKGMFMCCRLAHFGAHKGFGQCIQTANVTLIYLKTLHRPKIKVAVVHKQATRLHFFFMENG